MNVRFEHQQAIGRIAVAFGETEWLLHCCFATRLGKDLEIAELISDELGTFARRLNFITRFFDKSLDTERRRKFDVIQKRLAHLGTKRNDILHSAWMAHRENPAVVEHVITKTEKQNSRKLYSTTELNQLAEKIEHVNEQFIQFICDIPERS